MTAAKVVTKKEATIQTVSVDVKVIRFDKRQMTIGIFKQLEERWCFDTEGEKIGPMWGRVNYLWGDQAGIGIDSHLVWSDNERIYRCPIPQDKVGQNSSPVSVWKVINTYANLEYEYYVTPWDKGHQDKTLYSDDIIRMIKKTGNDPKYYINENETVKLKGKGVRFYAVKLEGILPELFEKTVIVTPPRMAVTQKVEAIFYEASNLDLLFIGG